MISCCIDISYICTKPIKYLGCFTGDYIIVIRPLYTVIIHFTCSTSMFRVCFQFGLLLTYHQIHLPTVMCSKIWFEHITVQAEFWIGSMDFLDGTHGDAWMGHEPQFRAFLDNCEYPIIREEKNRTQFMSSVCKIINSKVLLPWGLCL